MSTNNTATLVSLLLGMVDQAAKASALLAKTRAEGRQPTDEEMQTFFAADDKARAELQTAIDQAKAGKPDAAMQKGPIWGNL
jgi:hypothetical protein